MLMQQPSAVQKGSSRAFNPLPSPKLSAWGPATHRKSHAWKQRRSFEV